MESSVRRFGSVNRRPALGLLMSAAVSLGSCATNGDSAVSVFAEPKRFEGQVVRVCGYVSHPSTIDAKRKNADTGLNLMSADTRVRVSKGRQCFVGRIVYNGCATEEALVCLEWQYDYGLKLD